LAARPFWHQSPPRQLDEDLAAIRKALDSQVPDTSLALAVGEDLLDRIDRFPDDAGEIHFLVGSAYLRRASEVSREQATYAWQKARHHLQEAVHGGVPEGDRHRLMYRLARAWFHTGVDAPHVLDCLAQSSDAAIDDPAATYAMLTQLYLRLPQPNLQAALVSNAKQLALPTSDESLLAPARLLRGELLMRLGQADEARKVWARVPPTAPAGVYTRARHLRARSCQQDRLWQEAAALWEEIINDSREAPAEVGAALYDLGVCYRRLDRPKDAARAWERVLSQTSELRDIGQAAAFGLAELRLLDANPSSALECFERALRDVKGPGRYQNALVDLAEARRLVEQGCRVYLKAGDFERAQRLAQLDGQLAPKANQELLGQVAEAWAANCRRRATGSQAARLQEEATVHFREAGVAFQALADSVKDAPQQAPWLWRGAADFLQGRHYAQAVALLQRFIRVETEPQRLGQAWYTLADAYRALADMPAAQVAYHKCIEYPGPYAFRARYRLAQAEIEPALAANNASRLDDIQAALQQNLDLMRSSPDEEACQQTLRALADLLVRRGQYRVATVRLRELLERYPGHEDRLTTRRQLADCYRQLAALEDQQLRAGAYLTPEGQLHYRDQRRLWLQKASAHYQKLADDLAALGSARPLTDKEEMLLRQVGFAVAECHFEQGHYAEAIDGYEKMAARYPNQADVLKALQQITRCHWVQSDPSRARETAQRLREALAKLPDGAFKDQPDRWSRQDWEQWLEWAAKQ
jgi:tetratricopeptide (TPR) repeat protein